MPTKRLHQPNSSPRPVRIGVLSDIHGNLAALRATLAFLDAHDVSTIVCLGDVVGYGAQSSACIAVLRERAIPCVRGNHESYALAPSIPDDLHPDAIVGLRHARAELTPSDRRYLHSLPLQLTVHGLTLVHASLPEPLEWTYLLDPDDAARHLLAQRTRVSFFGHTHFPGGFTLSSEWVRELHPESSLHLPSACRACLNPGSVGRPRDGDLRASLLIWDADRSVAEFHRVEYDVDETINRLRQADLPADHFDRFEEAY